MAFSPQKSMKRLHRKYVKRCKDKNIYWELSVEFFNKLTSQPCVYCGKPPSQNTRGYLYNGIDRKNNKLGYDTENVVSCCGECNMLKGDRLSYEEMLHVGKCLAEFRNKNLRKK